MADLDEVLELLHKGIELYETLEDADKVPDAVKAAVETSQSGQLSASDENLNKLREIGAKWNNGVLKLSQRDETDWCEWSGSNLLNATDSFRAVIKTQELKRKLAALEEACDGLATLCIAAFVGKNMDVKSIAKLFVPSLLVADGIVAKEASANFKGCSANSARIIMKLDKILPRLEITRSEAMQIQGAFAHKLADSYQNRSIDGHNPPGRGKSVPGPW